MGVAAVEGLQGPGRLERLAEGKVFATLNHMTGHGQPQVGNNVAPAPLSERELRENFFPPFHEVLRRTSPAAALPRYNATDRVRTNHTRRLPGHVPHLAG